VCSCHSIDDLSGNAAERRYQTIGRQANRRRKSEVNGYGGLSEQRRPDRSTCECLVIVILPDSNRMTS